MVNKIFKVKLKYIDKFINIINKDKPNLNLFIHIDIKLAIEFYYFTNVVKLVSLPMGFISRITRNLEGILHFK